MLKYYFPVLKHVWSSTVLIVKVISTSTVEMLSDACTSLSILALSFRLSSKIPRLRHLEGDPRDISNDRCSWLCLLSWSFLCKTSLRWNEDEYWSGYVSWQQYQDHYISTSFTVSLFYHFPKLFTFLIPHIYIQQEKMCGFHRA